MELNNETIETMIKSKLTNNRNIQNMYRMNVFYWSALTRYSLLFEKIAKFINKECFWKVLGWIQLVRWWKQLSSHKLSGSLCFVSIAFKPTKRNKLLHLLPGNCKMNRVCLSCCASESLFLPCVNIKCQVYKQWASLPCPLRLKSSYWYT